MADERLVEIEGRCCECDYVFLYKVNTDDPSHRKLCDACESAGVIEP